MRGFYTALKEDMALEKRMLKQISRELKVLPEGRLKQGKNGKSVYVNETHSLPPEGKRTVDIARRNLLEKKRSVIEKNLKAQEVLLGRYQSYRDDRVLAMMRPVYQKIIGRAWTKDVRAREAARREAVQASIENGTAFHPEHLRNKNMKGDIIRSKGEVILDMLYDQLKIPYSYEERVYWPEDAPPEAWEIKRRLNIPDFYVPDFTFTMPDGTKKYHEHLGLMDREDYMENWKKKMILYYWAGITPGHNLIITADDRWGGIDMQQIMKIVEEELGELIGTAR